MSCSVFMKARQIFRPGKIGMNRIEIRVLKPDAALRTFAGI